MSNQETRLVVPKRKARVLSIGINKVKMDKKGVELSINFMIVAIIGLAILVVFFVAFTSNAGEFSKATQSCEVKGGKCVAEGECQNKKLSWSCPEEAPECCYE